MGKIALCLSLFIFTLFSSNYSNAASATNLAIEKLRLEYLVDPQGLDVLQPRFSWIVTSNARSQVQSAYRILVASSVEQLHKNKGDIWDSGKVISSDTNNIEYQGKKLLSGKKYYWKSLVWNGTDTQSSWSATANWSMGKLKFKDWQAEWIGHKVDYFKGDKLKDLHLPPSPYLRKEFNLDKPIKRATLYVTALGLYEMRLNGQRVGDEYFSPGWTDYNKRIYYRAFDVSNMLNTGTKGKGKNAIGGILADGWYAGYVAYALFIKYDKVREFYGERPALFAQLEIEYIDGSKEVIKTDGSWRATTGPILEADILMGETYDARLEMPGWDKPGFDDSTWAKAGWHTQPQGKLEAYPAVPVQYQEFITPKNISSPNKGTYIFDLGKNIAGKVRIKVKGTRGERVQLRFGELLKKDGSLMTENLRKARATDAYILKGSQAGDQDYEIWEPQFTYHGFQFVEITGLSYAPDTETVTGIVMNSSTPKVGNIHVQDDIKFDGNKGMVNQLFKNIQVTQFANFFDIPTDCPQRDERMGWTGDAQIYARSATYNADVASFFNKWLIDLEDTQTWYGGYTNFAPFPFSRAHVLSPAWTDAGIIVPFEMYRAYGDTRIINRLWDGMQHFMQYLADQAGDDYIRPGAGPNYGDWLSLDATKTSDDFLATAYYAYDAQLMVKMAQAIGKDKEAAHYQDVFEKVRAAFLAKFLASDGKLGSHTQTGYTMALDMGLIPPDKAAQVVKQLVDLITANDNKLSTGFLGVKHLLPVLSKYGYNDLAYKLFTSNKYPSWGFEVVNGATSIWERWNSYTKQGGFNKAMNSFSHYAFGSVVEWMYEYMGGITPLEAGFGKVRIKPYLGDELNGITTHYDSIRGVIETYWQQDDDQLILNVTIPANTTAEVYLPAADPKRITESDKALSSIKAITGIKLDNGSTVVSIGSGTYNFIIKMN
ncbi:MAG: family 78 glycoside hydrolase catalytic domain [Colwellia sp.]|nr:family 78 glycoside hydrolase catalytic domain [Colwellia sp.]